MKKFLVLLFIVSAMTAYSQKKDLTTVNTVKPKMGQKMAFEAAYKAHVAKFHKGDEKVNVYEILSGDYAGYYHIVDGGMSYSDLDKDRSDANVHSLDLDKTFFPLLEATKNGIYRLVDSLCFRPDATAEAYIVSLRHLNEDLNMEDYRMELSRGVKINAMMKGGFWENLNTTFYDQLWDGSDQITVTVRSLKDGFKSLEQGYYAPAPAGSPSWRETYEKTYGGNAWDARIKLMDGAVIKTEQYIMKLRKDLSSQ